MTTAGFLLGLYALRLERNDLGLTGPWTAALRTSMEELVETLKALPPGQTIKISANEETGEARFIVSETGDLAGVLPLSETNQ
jgi:hypothetical protein